MKLRKTRRDFGTSSDMTPMIDIIFQLIIFFMVVSQFTNVAVETLTLPDAKEGEEAEEGNGDRVIVNVHEDGHISVFGKTQTPEDLQAELEKRVEEFNKQQGVPLDAKDIGSKLSVIVRADKKVPWAAAAAALGAIQKAQIGRVRIAVTEAEGTGSQP